MTPNDDDLGVAPDPEGSYRREPYVPDDYDDRPTAKQLAYLRALAQRTGQTFAYPRTIFQASHEIRRLKRVKPSTRVDRAIERLDHASETAARGQLRRTGRPRRDRRLWQRVSVVALDASPPCRCQRESLQATGIVGRRFDNENGRYERELRDPALADSHWVRSTRGRCRAFCPLTACSRQPTLMELSLVCSGPGSGRCISSGGCSTRCWRAGAASRRPGI